MKISIISGSHRNPSQSEKIGKYVETLFKTKFSDIDPFLYTLADNPLPLWDQSVWEDDEEWNERLAPLKKQFTESDAFVIISPEWHGQVPAGLKNFFLIFNRFFKTAFMRFFVHFGAANFAAATHREYIGLFTTHQTR